MISFVSLKENLNYKEILDLQEREFKFRIDCRKRNEPLPDDKVFFAEHRPVYTIGKHGDISHLLLNREVLSAQGIEFYETDRGGDITYHGPGQLTVYPVMDMLRYRLGVKDYVNLLEQAVILTIGHFGIKGERIEGKTGVWLGKDGPNERKISAIGIKCSRFVTMHGLALNVGSDLSHFGGIVPCGLTKGVTSISLETGREIPVEEVKKLMEKSLTSLLLPRIPSQGNS